MNRTIAVHSSPHDAIRDFSRSHVWFLNLDADGPQEADRFLLSPRERARAEHTNSPEERRRFEARCAGVRRVLGGIVDIAPAQLEFRDDARGKPHLVIPDGVADECVALDFSISCTGGVLALAVAFDREVGIDIEVVKPWVDVLALAEAHLHPDECEWFRALPASERGPAFYRLWTREEALAKTGRRGAILPITGENGAEPRSLLLYSFRFWIGEKELAGALALRPERLANVDEQAA